MSKSNEVALSVGIGMSKSNEVALSVGIGMSNEVRSSKCDLLSHHFPYENQHQLNK